MDKSKASSLADEFEEQVERAAYLLENDEFKRRASLSRKWLGLPPDGLKPREKAIEWLWEHHHRHLDSIAFQAAQRDSIDTLRWGRLSLTLGAPWRPRLLDPSDEELRARGLPPARSAEGQVAEWKAKCLEWEARARLSPSLMFADSLAEDFGLPEFMLEWIERYIASNDEENINPAIAWLWTTPNLFDFTVVDGVMSAHIGSLTPITTESDWLRLWHEHVKPTLEAMFGALPKRRRRDPRKWTRNLVWQRARRRRKQAIAQVLEDYEAGLPKPTHFDETTAGKAIARVEALMQPSNDETLSFIRLLSGEARSMQQEQSDASP